MRLNLRRILPGLRAHDEARAQLEATRAELARVRGQWPLVHEIVERFTRHRERNGFSEAIANVYRGGKS